MSRRPPLENVFSWSASRAKTLDECARKYFLTYYGSWNGWQAPADSSPAQLYLLKKLDNRYTWSGHVAHAVIAAAVKSLLAGKPVDAEKFIASARQRMRDDFAASRARAKLREPARSLRQWLGGKFFGLVEHELGLQVPDHEWLKIWERTEKQLRWWFASDWPAQVDKLGAKGEEGDATVLFTDDGDFAKNRFAFDDTHVLSAPDLAFVDANGQAHAVDWKGGRPESSHVEQLTGYGEQLLERFGVPYERTQLDLVYLGRGTVAQQLDVGRVEAWREGTRSSIANMRSFLLDPTTNKAKPIEAFEQTREQSRCRFCPFRRRCDREGDDGTGKPAGEL